MSHTQYGNVVVVADERLIADEIRRILDHGGFTSVVTAGRPEELDALARQGPIAIVVLVLSHESTATTVRSWVDAHGVPRVPLLIVSGEADLTIMTRLAERLRPDAWIVKPFSAAQLLSSLTLVIRGRSARGTPDESGVHPAPSPHEVLRRIAHVLESAGVYPRTGEGPERVAVAFPGSDLLSVRERQVVDELVRHRSVARVARTLHLSEHTVRNHRKSIYSKLDVHSQDELVDLVTGRTFGAVPRAGTGPI